MKKIFVGARVALSVLAAAALLAALVLGACASEPTAAELGAQTKPTAEELWAQSQAGDKEAAEEFVKRVIAGDAEAVALTKRLSEQTRQKEEAEQRRQEAASRTQRGLDSEKAGDIAKAAASFEEALKLDPNNTEAKEGQARVKAEQERLAQEKAKAEQVKRAEQEKAARPALERGRAARQRGKTIEALACFHEALEILPSFGEAQGELDGLLAGLVPGSAETPQKDVEWRSAWQKLLDEAAAYFPTPGPESLVELVYDPQAKQGTVDYEKETVDYSFTAKFHIRPHSPSPAERVTEDLREGLQATGRNDQWKLTVPNAGGKPYKWPRPFYYFAFTAELVNGSGKVVGEYRPIMKAAEWGDWQKGKTLLQGKAALSAAEGSFYIGDYEADRISDVDVPRGPFAAYCDWEQAYVALESSPKGDWLELFGDDTWNVTIRAADASEQMTVRITGLYIGVADKLSFVGGSWSDTRRINTGFKFYKSGLNLLPVVTHEEYRAKYGTNVGFDYSLHQSHEEWIRNHPPERFYGAQ